MPYTVVIPLEASMVVQLENTIAHDKRKGLADAASKNICTIAAYILNQVFGTLNEQLRVWGYEKAYESSANTLAYVNTVVEKYFPYVLRLISTQKLQQVLKLYQQKIISGDVSHTGYAFEVSLPADIQQRLQQLAQANNPEETIAALVDVSVEVIDECVTVLVDEPKKQVKLNPVIDTTLSGIILVTKQLAYRELIKLKYHIQPAHSKLLYEYVYLYVRCDRIA